MAAMAMGLALAVALPVAACGDDTGGGSGGGGGAGGSGPSSTSSASTASGDGDGDGDGDGGASSSSAVSTYGTAVSSSSSGGEGGGSACLDEPFFEDPTCDSCVQDLCCAEVQACLADPANCSDAEGFIDPASSLGGPLLACLETECVAACSPTAGICDSGLTTSDPATDECLGAACCVEFNTCTSNSADIDACIACFDAGGGPLCDAAIACGEESCAG